MLTISPHWIACPSTPLLSGSAKNPSRPAESISQFLSRYASRSFTVSAFSGAIFSERDFLNRPCKSDSHLGLIAPFSDARGGGVAADNLAVVMKLRVDNGRVALAAPCLLNIITAFFILSCCAFYCRENDTMKLLIWRVCIEGRVFSAYFLRVWRVRLASVILLFAVVCTVSSLVQLAGSTAHWISAPLSKMDH